MHECFFHVSTQTQHSCQHALLRSSSDPRNLCAFRHMPDCSNVRFGQLYLVIPYDHRHNAFLPQPTNNLSSATQPCKLGCCGGSGYCGFGPTFCGAGNCTSGCDRKSECDPGWGSQWSNATDCPLNVCCSQYGFCGTTYDFCGDRTVTEPVCDEGGDSAKQRVVGYYEGWSQLRACDQSKHSACEGLDASTMIDAVQCFLDRCPWARGRISTSLLRTSVPRTSRWCPWMPEMCLFTANSPA